MSKWILNLLSICFILGVSLPSFAGGEIPWPFSQQFQVSEENSEGLWLVPTADGYRYFNVEIHSQEDGFFWIRITEIDPETHEILYYGEGFFCNHGEQHQSADQNPDVIKYLFLFPNAGSEYRPRLVRVAEVQLDWGMYLGLSLLYPSDTEESEHHIGTRTLKKPLQCRYHPRVGQMKCDLSPLLNPAGIEYWW